MFINWGLIQYTMEYYEDIKNNKLEFYVLQKSETYF